MLILKDGSGFNDVEVIHYEKVGGRWLVTKFYYGHTKQPSETSLKTDDEFVCNLSDRLNEGFEISS